MALIRFTESYIPTLEERKLVSNRKITEAEVTSLGKIDRLSESARRYIEDTPVAVLEGKTVWRVPISRYDWLNANGRVYEKKLWERVIREQCEAYQGNVGLADHPNDDKEGEFKEACVVWLNMGLDEANKMVWGECVFVGDQGRKAEEIMEVGGRVGFSSSGFGELSESDRSRVRWDTYQLERPADIVLNPSQHVFGRAGMQIKKENTEHTELKEKTMAVPETDDIVKLSKAEIRGFREQAESYLESARKIINPSERLGELEEIHSYWNESRMKNVALDLREGIEKEMEVAKTEIAKAITEHVKLREDFGLDTVESLKEGVGRLAVDTQLFERDLKEWKSIAEGLQDKVQKFQAVLATRPTAEAYKDVMDSLTRVKEIAVAKEKELLGRIGELQTELRKHELLEKKMVEDLRRITAEKTAITEENGILRETAKTFMAKLDAFAEADAAEEKEYKKGLQEQNEIRIHPEGDGLLQSQGFHENEKVVEYYKDLQRRHGKAILPFKERILKCKTVREAAFQYVRAIPYMDSSVTTKISEALDPAERRKIIEGQTMMRIVEETRLESRLPSTWE